MWAQVPDQTLLTAPAWIWWLRLVLAIKIQVAYVCKTFEEAVANIHTWQESFFWGLSFPAETSLTGDKHFDSSRWCCFSAWYSYVLLYYILIMYMNINYKIIVRWYINNIDIYLRYFDLTIYRYYIQNTCIYTYLYIYTYIICMYVYIYNIYV